MQLISIAQSSQEKKTHEDYEENNFIAKKENKNELVDYM